jgi:uncharacterized protein (DUF1778 family)
MSRLSIELTQGQHKQIKVLAALQGLSIRDYVLKHALPHLSGKRAITENEALASLEAFLAPRVKEAKQGKFSKRKVREIMAAVKQEA